MSDVLTIAMQRHEKLQAEVSKIERFLRIAMELAEMESTGTDSGLLTGGLSKSAAEPDTRRDQFAGESVTPEQAEKPGPNGRPSLFRGRFGTSEDERKVVNS
ncbi:MAG TPA: hypothetical protein VIS76_09635 [Pseudomonadales bacterium]